MVVAVVMPVMVVAISVTAMTSVAVVVAISAAVATVRFMRPLVCVLFAVLRHTPPTELFPKPVISGAALRGLLFGLRLFDGSVQERPWLHSAEDLFGDVFLHLFVLVNEVSFVLLAVFLLR